VTCQASAAMRQRVGPPVCVLGLGRSGTSLAARALNLLGVDLGPPERMLPASDWNPAGFWEQEPIMRLNEEILERFGGSYEEPPDLPEGWQRDPRVGDLPGRAAELVADLFADGRRWGFKDPRTVLTLALWQDVVGEMAYVICARDPFEAAASHLVGFPDYDTEHFLGLWLRSNAAALRQTAGRRRVVVLHEEWFSDPGAVAQRLHGLIGEGPVDEAIAAAIRDTVMPELHRQRAGTDGADAPLEVRAMMALLGAMARGEPEELQGLGASLDREWGERRARAADEAALRRELSRAQRAVATLSSSRSWRLTAPLRAAAHRLRR
jgi:hypothetical protein